MRRFALPGVISLVVAGLLALLAFGVAHNGPSNELASQISRGKQPAAPNANMQLALLGSSRKTTLSALRGKKIVMVNVFAGWCDTCQAEAGLLKHAQRLLSQHGGEVVGVTYDDSSSDAQHYMRTYGLRYPVLLDPAGSFVAAYGVNGVPETFIIGRSGRVLAAEPEEMTKGWMDRTLSRVLGTRA
jgi:cytochrome c biogenesis protein CcmG, thiol:disulfide interchange protein DsbE